jgi:hypothetical protein
MWNVTTFIINLKAHYAAACTARCITNGLVVPTDFFLQELQMAHSTQTIHHTVWILDLLTPRIAHLEKFHNTLTAWSNFGNLSREFSISPAADDVLTVTFISYPLRTHNVAYKINELE